MSDPTKNPFVEQFDQAVIHHEAREFADSIGYRFGVLTDGTNPNGPTARPAFWTRFVCPEHYKNPL